LRTKLTDTLNRYQDLQEQKIDALGKQLGTDDKTFLELNILASNAGNVLVKTPETQDFYKFNKDRNENITKPEKVQASNRYEMAAEMTKDSNVFEKIKSFVGKVNKTANSTEKQYSVEVVKLTKAIDALNVTADKIKDKIFSSIEKAVDAQEPTKFQSPSDKSIPPEPITPSSP